MRKRTNVRQEMRKKYQTGNKKKKNVSRNAMRKKNKCQTGNEKNLKF